MPVCRTLQTRPTRMHGARFGPPAGRRRRPRLPLHPIEERTEGSLREGGSPMTIEKKPCLSASGLTKTFGFGRQQTVAVDHVDFSFYEGEIVSIVGESGSGKTTLTKILLGLINPTEGDIYFQGNKRDISSQKKKHEYWKNIQAIFQDPYS